MFVSLLAWCRFKRILNFKKSVTLVQIDKEHWSGLNSVLNYNSPIKSYWFHKVVLEWDKRQYSSLLWVLNCLIFTTAFKIFKSSVARLYNSVIWLFAVYFVRTWKTETPLSLIFLLFNVCSSNRRVLSSKGAD